MYFGLVFFLDFVWRSGTTRTEGPHGAYVRGARRNRIGPHRGETEHANSRRVPRLGTGPATNPRGQYHVRGGQVDFVCVSAVTEATHMRALVTPLTVTVEGLTKSRKLPPLTLYCRRALKTFEDLTYTLHRSRYFAAFFTCPST